MPIHLPPVSRRTFLIRSLLAGTALSWCPRLAAAGRTADANRLALLADTHVAADPSQANKGVVMADHLAKAVRALAGQPAPPAGVFVAGDVAYSSGETADYATFARLVEPLRQAQIPVHIALGNHDHRERFWGALAEEKNLPRPVGSRQTALLKTPRANWFMLDSLETTLSTPGRLGTEQLDWLARTLDAHQDLPALIVAHHNPGKLYDVEGLKDTDAFLRILRPRKHVQAFFFGHTHHWSVTTDESGFHLVNLPPVAYVFRKDDPSGWVEATIESGGMRLELRCVDPAHTAHGRVLNLKWRA
jgi:Icc protein